MSEICCRVSCSTGLRGLTTTAMASRATTNSTGSMPLACGGGDLLCLHLARGVGDIHRAVDHRGDAGARAAAGDRDAHLGMRGGVGLGPGQRQVDQRVRALVLDRRGRRRRWPSLCLPPPEWRTRPAQAATAAGGQQRRMASVSPSAMGRSSRGIGVAKVRRDRKVVPRRKARAGSFKPITTIVTGGGEARKCGDGSCDPCFPHP